jgi:hypothetical protein
MATDERNKSFFKDLADHYDIVYLDDFAPLLKGVNTNFYGMIDQLITSRSRVFFGCWFSTFTGYINRIRGTLHMQMHYAESTNTTSSPLNTPMCCIVLFHLAPLSLSLPQKRISRRSTQIARLRNGHYQ